MRCWIFQKTNKSRLQNERGSALPSVLLFLLVLSAFLVSLSQSARNLLFNHSFIQNNYEAQAMITLTESVFEEQAENGEEAVGTYVFDKGTVDVKRLNLETIRFQATLSNGLVKTETRRIRKAEEELNEEELNEEPEQNPAENNSPEEPENSRQTDNTDSNTDTQMN